MAAIEDRDPFEVFGDWFKDARSSNIKEPTAMALATVSLEGRPSVRMVLLKEFSRAGFVFYTNTESRKGGELLGCPVAALCFHWMPLERQVRIEGAVTRVSDMEADAYFASRPRSSQIGAWASDQSRAMAHKIELEKNVLRYGLQFHVGTVPRPPHWTGFRVVPDRIEFWQGKPHRLHERIVFNRDGVDQPWSTQRLFP